MHIPLYSYTTLGVNSAWNGDYHLNINMQMSYWAADAVGASETVKPLLSFLTSLANSSEDTIRKLYNCSGWVAHGFTDNSYIGGLYGDPQWALCVTCGAWLLVQAFEHISYKWNATLLYDVLLPIMRKSVLFFTGIHTNILLIIYCKIVA